MNSFQLISQLVNLIEEFEQSNKKSLSLENFSGFLNSRLADQGNYTANADVRFGKEQPEAQEMAYQLDNNIARLFIFMSRYAKSYIKKALLHTSLATAEDFTCLAILLTHSSLSKSELIQLNLIEKTSGTEIINRLLSNELVTQWDDQEDKRSKRIAISQKGKELLYVVFADMNHVSKIITGKLTLSEKITLQYLLQQLENFHFGLHNNKSITNRNDIVAWNNN
ncbi:MAG: winged helix DNA-binding protein [Pedobacter sp.]|nr:winged helix DNA-binding protein [Pedobacter sp.]